MNAASSAGSSSRPSGSGTETVRSVSSALRRSGANAASGVVAYEVPEALRRSAGGSWT